ncbi:hypothetical protein L198_08117 [Cryptococcus wingfieldii CBS 7118]|uniref:Uncharacterized protein n=1 Tax=Cryptococcus wingfieldii CBS 7118 TaxID=1295528 RepID=A0A1E3HLM1_9TREE|nr:hypothetical protein L198_08117 [Cryptococcus wingfieldii CBS 7118]ODN76341.1 hypothetical protein L198_08117 [Cryptococcus wingfieldii CBS 7118]
MPSKLPADGQIIAAILEIIDQINPSPHPSFAAPAISISHLASTLHTSPTSLAPSPSHIADLIRPLSETLFDAPREPVVRSVRKGLSKEVWIVFERTSRPGDDNRRRAVDEPRTPRAGHAPLASLPRPPSRPRARDEPLPTADVKVEAKPLHLIPTFPGGSSYTPPSPTLHKRNRRGGTLFRPFGKSSTKEEVPSLPDFPPHLSSETSGGLAVEKTAIRQMARGDGGSAIFDPMRDVAPPTPVSYGSVPFPSPKPHHLSNESTFTAARRHVDTDRQRQVENMPGDDDGDGASFDIIDAYADPEPEQPHRTLNDNVLTQPPSTSQNLRVDVSERSRESTLTPVQEERAEEGDGSDREGELSEAFEHDRIVDALGDDVSDEDDDVGRASVQSDDEAEARKPTVKSKDDIAGRGTGEDAASKIQRKRDEGASPGDEMSLDEEDKRDASSDGGGAAQVSEDSHEVPEPPEKRRHKHEKRHKSKDRYERKKHSDKMDKTWSQKKHKHAYESVLEEPETPWLVQTFEGLPFEPAIPTVS